VVTIVLILLLPQQACGQGSKKTRFHLSMLGVPSLLTIDVYLSWDCDSWNFDEDHEVALTVEVVEVKSGVQNLTVELNEIEVRLKLPGWTETILSEDVSNRITALVSMSYDQTIFHTSRSFSYTVQAPLSLRDRLDSNRVKLYYVIELGGHYDYKSGTSESHGWLDGEYVSNEGTISGGLEDPVWIELAKGGFIFPVEYLLSFMMGVGIAVIIISWLLLRKKKTVAESSPLP